MAKRNLNLENIDKVRKYFDEIKPDLFQIKNHPLADKEDYIKELYISVLCSISAYDDDMAESETLFIKRIMRGVNLKTEFAKLARQGLDIKKQTVDEFIKHFSENDLGYYFIADALVVAVSDGILADKEIELIAELSELLKITRSEIETLSGLIAVLISQNSDDLALYLKNNELKTDLTYLIKGIFPDYVDNSKKIVFTGDVVFDKDITLMQDEVIFDNARITIKKNVKILINLNKSVSIYKCEFTAESSDKIVDIIELNKIGKIEIRESLFHDVNKRLFLIRSCENVQIHDNRFIKCGLSSIHSETIYGGVFEINASKGDIKDNSFEFCFISNEKKKITYYIEIYEKANGFIACFTDSKFNFINNYITQGYIGDKEQNTESGAKYNIENNSVIKYK